MFGACPCYLSIAVSDLSCVSPHIRLQLLCFLLPHGKKDTPHVKKERHTRGDKKKVAFILY